MQISRTVARPSLVVARTTWFGSHSATMREIAQYPTALPADCVARCPDEPGLVVCGTYDYDKATKVRSGTLTLHCVSESGATSSTPIQVPSGVFDLCWQRRASGKNVAITPPAGHKTGNTGSMLACAAADGKVHLYSLLSVPTDADAAGCPFSLVLESNFGLDTANDESADLYCLAADWCGNALLTSYTNGSLGLFDSPTESLVRSWDAAHVFYGAPSEVWACAIDPHSSSVLYSGADDGLFKSWDARVDGEKPTGQSRKMDVRGQIECVFYFETSSSRSPASDGATYAGSATALERDRSLHKHS
jgi:WD40 repeat protein